MEVVDGVHVMTGDFFVLDSFGLSDMFPACRNSPAELKVLG